MLILKVGNTQFALTSLTDAEAVLRILASAQRVKTKSTYWPNHVYHVVLQGEHDEHEDISVSVVTGTPITPEQFAAADAASELARPRNLRE